MMLNIVRYPQKNGERIASSRPRKSSLKASTTPPARLRQQEGLETWGAPCQSLGEEKRRRSREEEQEQSRRRRKSEEEEKEGEGGAAEEDDGSWD